MEGDKDVEAHGHVYQARKLQLTVMFSICHLQLGVFFFCVKSPKKNHELVKKISALRTSQNSRSIILISKFVIHENLTHTYWCMKHIGGL